MAALNEADVHLCIRNKPCSFEFHYCFMYTMYFIEIFYLYMYTIYTIYMAFIIYGNFIYMI